jgi:hypothetical protein
VAIACASRARTISASSTPLSAALERAAGTGSGVSAGGARRGRSCGMNSLFSPSVQVKSSGRSIPRPGIAVDSSRTVSVQSSPVVCSTTAAVSTRICPRADA